MGLSSSLSQSRELAPEAKGKHFYTHEEHNDAQTRWSVGAGNGEGDPDPRDTPVWGPTKGESWVFRDIPDESETQSAVFLKLWTVIFSEKSVEKFYQHKKKPLKTNPVLS